MKLAGLIVYSVCVFVTMKSYSSERMGMINICNIELHDHSTQGKRGQVYMGSLIL